MHENVIIITGASKGIGKSIAFELAKHNPRLVLTARNQNDLEQVKVDLLQEFPALNVLIYALDISKSQDVATLIETTLQTYKKIDVLINNAGVLKTGYIWETSEEDWDYVIDINLKGTFLCAKAVIPHMIRQESGYIINISSGAGKRASGEWGAYSASKFGVMGLTESMIQELRPYGIKVTALCPGPTNTPIFNGLNRTDLDTMLPPQYIAKTVEFLLTLPAEATVPEISVRPTCR